MDDFRICYAKDCNTPIAPNRMFCWPHWKRVPRSVQAVIWESNYLSHPAHESSRLAARASIAAKEGRDLTPEEREALAAYGLGPDGRPRPARAPEHTLDFTCGCGGACA